MDSNYLGYLNKLGVDPSQYIEMQANYLRFLATCYTVQEKPKASQGKIFVDQEKLILNQEKPEPEPLLVEIGDKEDNKEPIITNIQQDLYDFKKPAYDHDEIPVKPIDIPFEKLLEAEIQKTNEIEQKLSESKSKYEFLKRKSQKVLIPKETVSKNFKSKFVLKKPEDKIITETISNSNISIEDALIPSEHIENETKEVQKHLDAEDSQFYNKKFLQSPSKKLLSSPDQDSDPLKPKQMFLKRGEGKLCIKPRSASSNKSDLKHSNSMAEIQKDSLSETESKPHSPQRAHNKNFYKYKKLAKDLEEKKIKLEKDTLDFYKMKEAEIKNLEAWKKEEIKAIKDKEKKHLKYPIENKPDVFEIEKLKREVSQLKEIISKSEEKHNKAIEDLKDIIEVLTARNKELEKIVNSDKYNEHSETDEKNNNVSHRPKKPLTKNHGFKGFKEETPKFNKIEVSKDAPTFTFKLPDKKAIEKKSKIQKVKPFKQPVSTPVIEIKIEEPKTQNTVQEIVEEGKTQKIYDDGKKEILFSNGVKKEIFPDGYVIVNFNNKDKKETYPDGKIIYHFFENKTVQTTFPDGLQLFQFSNGQTEKHSSDGTKEIKFPDGTTKYIFNDGQEKSIFPDGTVQKIDINGVKQIEFVNGMKDTIMPDGTKIRQYPDGKIKKTLSDGKLIEQ
jgi:T-complex protein 10 C-terminus